MKRTHLEWLLIAGLSFSGCVLLFSRDRDQNARIEKESAPPVGAPSLGATISRHDPILQREIGAEGSGTDPLGALLKKSQSEQFAFRVSMSSVQTRWLEGGLGPTLPLEWADALGLTSQDLNEVNVRILKTLSKMQDWESHEKKLRTDAEGDVYVIPQYPSECAKYIQEFRESCKACLGEKCGVAIDIAAASPHFNAGFDDVTISAVTEGDKTGAYLAVGKNQVTSMASGIGLFVKTRYRHLIDFTAIERANTK